VSVLKELIVNGKSRAVEAATIAALLEQLGVNPGIVAVEYNGTIVRREAYGAAELHDGDVLEIVRMVGGGAA
jgi:thiamine biosynthesis protein ThiS